MGEIVKENVRLYTIQIKDENDKINPTICRREKVDNKVVLTPINWIQGKFKKLELSTYYSEVLDKNLENINLYLSDDDWEYKLSTSRTSIGRTLINTLAWEKKLGELTIKVYAKEDANRKVRPRIAIYNDWEKTNWKLSIEEQKALVEPITKKDWTFVSNDYSMLDEKLKSFVDTINNKTEKKEVWITESWPEEDLPF